MRALAISHQRDAGPGVFAEAIERAGAELDTWHIAEDVEPPADPHRYDAVITFGGAMHADQEDRHPWLAGERRLLAELLERGTPLLGVCLGAQLLAEAAGGGAVPARRPEIGWVEVAVTDGGAADPLFAGLAPRFEAFEWHSYEAVLPDDAAVLARSAVCTQAFRVGERAWGIQFHAEVSTTHARRWIAKYTVDPGEIAIGVDLKALGHETERKIAAFNDLGRALCARWLALVAVAERA